MRELELGTDMASLNNLLGFLEKVFNGGSDFNEPIKRCLDRMAEAKWANSDILLVSDGELRQPGQEVHRFAPANFVKCTFKLCTCRALFPVPLSLSLAVVCVIPILPVSNGMLCQPEQEVRAIPA